MRRKVLLGFTAALAAVALVAMVAAPAGAQDGASPTQDQYEPPEPPGGGEAPGGEEGELSGGQPSGDAGAATGQRFIGVSAVPVPGAAAGAQEALPLTGFDLRLLLLIAAALLAAGLLLSAAARARARRLERHGAAGA